MIVVAPSYTHGLIDLIILKAKELIRQSGIVAVVGMGKSQRHCSIEGKTGLGVVLEVAHRKA